MNCRVTRILAAAVRGLLLAILSLQPALAFAHEGHAEAPVARSPAPGLAPRLAASSPDFELLAVWQEGKLLVYLDRFATNEPVKDATIEIESAAGAGGANRASAVAVSEGLYQAQAPWLASPGQHALVFTVQASDADDLLNGTLEVPAAHAAGNATSANGHGRSWAPWLAYTAAGALTLLIVVLSVRRIGRKA